MEYVVQLDDEVVTRESLGRLTLPDNERVRLTRMLVNGTASYSSGFVAIAVANDIRRAVPGSDNRVHVALL